MNNTSQEFAIGIKREVMVHAKTSIFGIKCMALRDTERPTRINREASVNINLNSGNNINCRYTEAPTRIKREALGNIKTEILGIK